MSTSLYVNLDVERWHKERVMPMYMEESQHYTRNIFGHVKDSNKKRQHAQSIPGI